MAMKKAIALVIVVALNGVGRVVAGFKQAQDSAFIQSYTRIPPKQMAQS